MDNKCEKCGTEVLVGMWPFCRGEASAHGKPSLYTEKTYPFVTKNFDGTPIEVTSKAHEKALMQKHGVTKRDDCGFLTKEYVGYDGKTGKQVYKEASGVGLPGCWV